MLNGLWYPQIGLEILTGVTLFHFCYLFWRTLRDDLAASAATFRAEVNDMVGDLDNVQIVLDNHNRVAGVS